MVTRSRPALGAGLVTMLALAVGAPALGAFELVEPNPLRTGAMIRLADVATAGDAVAIGWREGSGLDNLRTAISTNRGRRFDRIVRVGGTGRIGMAIDICDGSVWMVTAAGPASAPTSNILLSRRGLGGGVGQAFVLPSSSRKVRAVDIACIGNRLLAIAWIEKSGDRTRARLFLRDTDLRPSAASASTAGSRVAPSATRSFHNLGQAGGQDGISVAAAGSRVFVAWSSGARRNLQLKRFDIGSGGDPTIEPRPVKRVGFRDAVRPKLTAAGPKVVLAYTDDGKLKWRMSTDQGGSFSAAETLLNQGTVKVPSFATSATMVGPRIVIEAMKKQPNGAARVQAPVRIQSRDKGDSWNVSSEFGNRGPRMGALRKVSRTVSRLNEAWHDDGPSVDVLRAAREVAG